MLGDRFGGKRLVGFGLIFVGVLNAAFGVGQTFLFFLIAWTLNGFAQSTGWPGCAKAFSQWYAREERGTVMGLWCTCYQVGGVVATFIATYLVSTIGWQSAFFGPALIVGGFGVLVLAFQRDSPQQEGLPSVETYYHAVTGKGAPAEDDNAPPAKASLADWMFVLKSGTLWTLGLTYVVLKLTRYTFLFWLPFYMSNQLGYGEGEAGYTATVFSIAGLVGAIFAGVASDRIFGGRRAPIVVIMLVLLAGATWFYADLSMLGRWPNIIGIAAIGFLIFGPDSVTSGVAAVDFGEEKAAAAAAGFVNGLGSIGGALSGVIAGRLSEAYGWNAVFIMFTPMCLLAAMLMATMWNKTPKHA